MAARKGELHHKAKLTEDLVRELRRVRAEQGLSYLKLCELSGWVVGKKTLEHAVSGKTWKHVQ